MSHGPIGLGFRVPTIVVSPFARNPQPGGGPLVDSTRYDHTSLLRFVETWSHAIGKPAPIPNRDAARRRPGLSAWRRSVVGDLTASLSLGRAPDASVPTDVISVVPNRADPRVLTECTVTGTIGSLSASTEPIVMDPAIPAKIPFPTQDRANGSVRRPTAVRCAHTGNGRGGRSSQSSGDSGSLAATGGDNAVAIGGLAALLAAATLALRRRVRDDTPGSDH
jgi:phospholipase C